MDVTPAGRVVTVVYHRGVDTRWWADSPDVPNLVVAADTLVEVRDLVRDATPRFLGVAPHDVEIREALPGRPPPTAPA